MNQLKTIFLFAFVLVSLNIFAQSERPQVTKEGIEEEKVIDIPTEALAPAPSEEKEVFKVADEMPRFRGCEEMVEDKQDRKNCASRKLLEYLYGNLKYPPQARVNGTQGMVIVRFIIEPDGSLTNLEVTKDIGDGCGEAALKVVESMPNWIPGKQEGKEVPVTFTLPVKFKLATGGK